MLQKTTMRNNVAATLDGQGAPALPADQFRDQMLGSVQTLVPKSQEVATREVTDRANASQRLPLPENASSMPEIAAALGRVLVRHSEYHGAVLDFATVILHSIASNVVVWVVSPLCIIALGYSVHRIGGWELLNQVFPVGIAVCMCVSFSLLCSYLGSPWNYFSATSAIITVIFVMEMGSFERFLIKTTLRSLGTFLGGVIAVICAELAGLVGNRTPFMVTICMFVFTCDAMMAKLFKDVSYIFMMASVTFALVFFGYIQNGMMTVWGRIFSVLYGEMSATIVIIVFSMLSGEWHHAKSACNIVRRYDTILGKVMTAVDFAFARNMINSLVDEGVDVAQIKERSFRKDVREFLKLDTAEDLAELKSSTIAASFTRLPLDSEVVSMQGECRIVWGDMQLVRSASHLLCCKRQVFSQLPNLGGLFDLMHTLYVQVSALAHAAPVDPKVWRSEGARLDTVHAHIQRMQEPWSRVCKLQIETLKDAKKVFQNEEAQRDSFLACFKDMADTLQAGSLCLASERIAMMGRASLVGPKGISRQLWRFDAFCQSLDIIIAELSSLAMALMKILKLEEDEDGVIMTTLSSLASMGGRQFGELDAAVHAMKSARVTFWDALRRPYIPSDSQRQFQRGDGNLADHAENDVGSPRLSNLLPQLSSSSGGKPA
jgi:hypothetical protein